MFQKCWPGMTLEFAMGVRVIQTNDEHFGFERFRRFVKNLGNLILDCATPLNARINLVLDGATSGDDLLLVDVRKKRMTA